MGELRTGETWSRIHVGGQHFQIQADMARMSVAQDSAETQRQMFRNVSPEGGHVSRDRKGWQEGCPRQSLRGDNGVPSLGNSTQFRVARAASVI